MTLDEVAKTWLEIESAKASPANKICIQLLILTGARQSEIRLAQWAHFNFEAGVWTVPSEISKTNKPIRRPIPVKTKQLLDQLALIYGKMGLSFPVTNLIERSQLIALIALQNVFGTNFMIAIKCQNGHHTISGER